MSPPDRSEQTAARKQRRSTVLYAGAALIALSALIMLGVLGARLWQRNEGTADPDGDGITAAPSHARAEEDTRQDTSPEAPLRRAGESEVAPTTPPEHTALAGDKPLPTIDRRPTHPGLGDLFREPEVLRERIQDRDNDGDRLLRRTRLVRVSGPHSLVACEDWVSAIDKDRPVARSDRPRTIMVADHVIVKLRPGVKKQQLERLARAHAGGIKRKLRGLDDIYLVELKQPGVKQVREAIKRFRVETASIAYAEPDYIVHTLATPDDPFFNETWGLHNTGQQTTGYDEGGTADADIDAPTAWDIETGKHEVLVGVIDTGIDYTHPDLAANMWQNPGETGTDENGSDKRFNGVDDDGNGYVDDWRGWDFCNNDNDPMDDHFHGTHCAGTIAAVGNNGTGVVGEIGRAHV